MPLLAVRLEAYLTPSLPYSRLTNTTENSNHKNKLKHETNILSIKLYFKITYNTQDVRNAQSNITHCHGVPTCLMST